MDTIILIHVGSAVSGSMECHSYLHRNSHCIVPRDLTLKAIRAPIPVSRALYATKIRVKVSARAELHWYPLTVTSPEAMNQ